MQVRNAPITVQNVVTYDTVIGVNNADLKLKPGMTANVSIVGAQRDDVLKISNAALRFVRRCRRMRHLRRLAVAPGSAGATPVASDRDRAHGLRIAREAPEPSPVQIKTGISDGISTEVLEGLKEGDRVVTAMTGKAASTPRNQRTILRPAAAAPVLANRDGRERCCR